MKTRPVVITAPSAHCGKTALACHLIAATPGTQALKITRFHRESNCPVHGVNEVGEDNCDGCAPVPSGFELVDDEETLTVPGKDSTRMLAAGASPVFWLRAAPHVFRYALGHALKRFATDRPLIVEGNSAATIDNFDTAVALIWTHNSRGVKSSVIPALRRADVLVLVESEGEIPQRWPASLIKTLARNSMEQSDLPPPSWLSSQWWRKLTPADQGVIRQIHERVGLAQVGV